jgi:epoxyqueuosine reductase
MSYSPAQLRQQISAQAQALGISALGVAPVSAELRVEYYRRWIAEGKHGSMQWMDNPKREDPRQIMPECQAIIVAGLNYYQPSPLRDGRIATYALGRDYHKVLLKKLQKLAEAMEALGGQQRAYVDTGPILEKRFGAATSLGWQGKNTMLISPKWGNWLSLGVILTTLPLPTDNPHPDRCGSCTRCMRACPTGAITAPYQLDARRCIAYLTIEHKGAIPLEYRRAIGDRLFGCEECLTVCPWNRWAEATHEIAYTPRQYPSAREMLALTEDEFFVLTAGTPLKRLGLARLKRNACIVLGNSGDSSALPELEALAEQYSNHPEEGYIAETAAWAIEQIKSR